MFLRTLQAAGEMVENSAKIALAPAAIAVQVANATLKPVADLLSEAVEIVHEGLKDDEVK